MVQSLVFLGLFSSFWKYWLELQSSAGAYSLLTDCNPKTLASIDISPGSLVSDAGYAVTTYGLSNKMDWHASSITVNSQGGQDYILVNIVNSILESR